MALDTIINADERVKAIGRTHMYRGARWAALSGSGVAFTFFGKRAEVTILGDDIASGDHNYARVGIEVNGVRVIDDLIDGPTKTYTVFESDTEQDVTVQLIKLSEAPMSTIGIGEIRVDAAEGIRPAAAKSRKIEFIGDSITAGYGVDDEHAEHHFSTATEDVTKTYAYKTAKALDADYSMAAYSGYGIISGYSGDGQPVPAQRVPLYYERVGMSYGKFGGDLTVESLDWDFSRFVPDLIVINLGTNDDSYTKDDAAKQAEYAAQYEVFLRTVRRCNPEAYILCTLGIMGDRLYPYVERAVADYRAATGDTRIASMKFNVQSADDGYAADWHPSQATHTKAAEKLTAAIRSIMNWE